jgi:hypothetical protein
VAREVEHATRDEGTTHDASVRLATHLAAVHRIHHRHSVTVVVIVTAGVVAFYAEAQ